jgi:cytochrome oxidase Cu insertion factor (SCO1/SenC/PrrC family)
MTSVGARGTTPFGRQDLLGKVWIADFIFTRCAGPCPILSTRLAALAQELPPSIGLLTVAVDSEGDTPERLRAYAKRYGAQAGRWVFLRGTHSETYNLLYAGFRLPLSVNPSAPEEERAVHSTRFVLVDKNGGIFGYYDGLSDSDNAALARDARRLLEVGS